MDSSNNNSNNGGSEDMAAESSNNNLINPIVEELEAALAEQKAFKKRPDVKAVFDENRGYNKQIKEIKDRLREAMKETGETTVTVGSIEVEIKPASKEKHDLELLEQSMGADRFNEYLSHVSVADDKVVTRRAGKKRARTDDGDS
jgi:seryl-tRNA synthetase